MMDLGSQYNFCLDNEISVVKVLIFEELLQNDALYGYEDKELTKIAEAIYERYSADRSINELIEDYINNDGEERWE